MWTRWQRAGSVNVLDRHICRLKTCFWYLHAEYLNRYHWKTMFSHFPFLYKAKVIFILIFLKEEVKKRLKFFIYEYMNIFEIFLKIYSLNIKYFPSFNEHGDQWLHYDVLMHFSCWSLFPPQLSSLTDHSFHIGFFFIPAVLPQLSCHIEFIAFFSIYFFLKNFFPAHELFPGLCIHP